MISTRALFSWLTTLDMATIAVFIWALFKISRSRVKNSFILFFIAGFLWLNLVLIFRVPTLTDNTAELISLFIFLLAVIIFSTFTIFTIEFSDSRFEYRKILFWLLQGNNLILFLLSFTNEIQTGIAKVNGVHVATYGRFHFYYVFSLLLMGVYSFWLMARQYFKGTNEFLKYQIQGILISGLISFVFIATTNLVMPAIDNTQWSFLGPIGSIYFLVGITHSLANGKSLYLKGAFRQLLKDKAMQNDVNTIGIRKLIGWIDYFINNETKKFQKSIEFITNSEKKQKIYLSDIDFTRSTAKVFEKGIPYGYAEGLLDTLKVLSIENKHLAFNLMKAEGQARDSQLLDPVEQQLIMIQNNYLTFETYVSELESNLSINREIYGQELLCFSTEYLEVLLKAQKFAKTNQPIAIEGELGSGRIVVTQAIHFLRTKTKSEVISSLGISFKEIRAKVDAILDTGKKQLGLIIRDIDALDANSLQEFFNFLSQLERQIYIYFTVQPDFLSTLSATNDIFYRLNLFDLKLPPLREHPEDILHLLLFYINIYAKEANLNFTHINKDAVKRALKHKWPGNLKEIQKIAQIAVIENKAPRIDKLKIGTGLIALQGATLTPLEMSEKNVIANYLIKNNGNKSRTIKDLCITMNTLNSKIIKYHLKVVKSK